MRYPPETLDAIRTNVGLVELVGRTVTLAKAGPVFRGLCPFHGEKTPSFIVTPKRGTWHCFGCGAGGDVFGWLMRINTMTFPDAVRTAATRAHVPLPDDPSPKKRLPPHRPAQTFAEHVREGLRATYREARRQQAAIAPVAARSREIREGWRMVTAARALATDTEAGWTLLSLASVVETDVFQLEAS